MKFKRVEPILVKFYKVNSFTSFNFKSEFLIEIYDDSSSIEFSFYSTKTKPSSAIWLDGESQGNTETG